MAIDQDSEIEIAIAGVEEETAPELLDRYRDSDGKPRPELWRTGIDDLNRLDVAPGAVWNPVGPNPMTNTATPRVVQGVPPVAGEVTDIAIDPSGAADTIIYAATNNGGIWKTTNGGGSWIPTSDGLPSLSMGAVAIDPGNPSIIYAGSGNLFDGSGGFIKASGLYKSVDAGQTWFVADGGVFGTLFAGYDSNGNGFGIGINRIVCTAADRLLVGTASGLYRSIDGGMNFGANAPNFDDGKPIINGFVSVLTMDTTNPDIAWVGIRGLNAGLKSFSGGGLFQLVLAADGSVTPSHNLLQNPGGVGGTRFGSIAFAQTTTPNNITLFVSVQDEPGPPAKPFFVGLWVSRNLGNSWTLLPNLKAGLVATKSGTHEEDDQSSYDFTLGVDPQNPNLVYAGFKRIWISQNGGAVFNLSAPQGQVHWDQHELVFSPQSHWGAGGAPTTVYVGSDGGVARSTNGGVNWGQLNANAATHLFLGIDIGRGAANNQVTFGGSQDNGTAGHRSTDPVAQWLGGIDGDGGIPAVDPANPNIIYGFDNSFFIKSSDGGNNWALSNDTSTIGMTNATNASPIQITSNGHLFQTGDTVTITGVLGNTAANGKWTVSVAPNNPNNFTLNGSTGNGVYQAGSGSVAGRRIGRGLANPDSFIRRVALVPNGANPATTVYVAEQASIRKSTDGGANFAKDPIKTFDGFIFSMLCPDANRIWVGTGDGQIHFSPDGGSSWADASPGCSGPVTGIAIDPNDINHVAIVSAGFSGLNSRFRTHHCFVTTNGGNDWTDISGVDGRDKGNLPDLPFHSVVFEGSSGLVVATDGTVLHTAGDFVTWRHAGAGLPRSTCRSLAIDNTVPEHPLRIGTYGRSCFELTKFVGPRVLVEANLAFGGVPQGKTATLQVRLFNIGDSSVNLTSFSRTAGDADFDFVSAPDLSPLNTAVIRTFDIRFTADGNGVRTATFTLVSNDAVNPSILIPASGLSSGGGKARVAVNANLNFGRIHRGESLQLSFIVANSGLADLNISQLGLHGDDDFEMTPPALPLKLEPGAQQSIDVKFAPGTWGGSSHSKLNIASNDPRVTQPIPLAGSSPFNIALLLGAIALGAAVAVGGFFVGELVYDELKKL